MRHLFARVSTPGLPSYSGTQFMLKPRCFVWLLCILVNEGGEGSVSGLVASCGDVVTESPINAGFVRLANPVFSRWCESRHVRLHIQVVCKGGVWTSGVLNSIATDSFGLRFAKQGRHCTDSISPAIFICNAWLIGCRLILCLIGAISEKHTSFISWTPLLQPCAMALVSNKIELLVSFHHMHPNYGISLVKLNDTFYKNVFWLVFTVDTVCYCWFIRFFQRVIWSHYLAT